MKRVLLILADGMRPDSLAACGNPVVNKILAHSVYTLEGKTVMPSVTLPCHMSLFHSVTPERHGILTNIYVPQVRPVRGLCEVLKAAGLHNAFFYNWEELKDLSRPDSMAFATFVSGHTYGYEVANERLVNAAIPYLQEPDASFTFLYLGWPDEAGHHYGWMSEEYLHAVSESWNSMDRVISTLTEEDLVVITADHGGHGRSHGADIPEDMTIPILFYNPRFTPRVLDKASILDIAPTITNILGVAPDGDWEGKPLPVL